ncbi:alpha/beta hydrolase [Mycobacterium sp. 21AC1]|uniref:alpha/beta hydrolase n=1 Tax=[Mycobacterium] appelbergii TaxID=2939269 RepID=UPI002938FC1B|nr:alpha/beta hydrolase [Mycobacterium sp. 21AC1]MDV3126460.1 alpha/beta hydrolase [Mycobacterium sp. 21AC1]
MKLALTDLFEPANDDELAITRSFYESRPAGVGPSSLSELQVARSARLAEATAPGPAAEHTVERDGTRVTVRIVTPSNSDVNGLYLFFPAGGFYLSSAAHSDARNTRIAEALGMAVVTVDYRLAPESPWPAAPDDCETAALWLLDVAAERFGTTKIALGGMSAGSTLVMATLLRLRDRGLAKSLVGAVLEAGTYDLSGQTPAGRTIADEYFIEAYVGHVRDRTVPDISPTFGDLRGLPPTLVVIGSDDVVLAENLAMAARLSAAGNCVDLRLYPHVPHGFSNHPTPIARRAVLDIDAWLRSRFESAG